MSETYSPRTCPTLRRGARLSVDGIVGRNSWSALLKDPAEAVRSPVGRTARTEDRRQAADQAGPKNGGGALSDRVMRTLKRKGYVFHDDGKPYHLNIVGIRNPSTVIDNFVDRLVLIYRDEDGKQYALEYSITTDPGAHYTQVELMNKAGAAIMVPGQYLETYNLGIHGKKYEALRQDNGTVRVWRDANMDAKLDRAGHIYEGNFYIHIHRGNSTGRTNRIGKYSAGCQVFQNADDFNLLISLAKKSRALRGNKFTYTLLEEADLG